MKYQALAQLGGSQLRSDVVRGEEVELSRVPREALTVTVNSEGVPCSFGTRIFIELRLVEAQTAPEQWSHSLASAASILRAASRLGESTAQATVDRGPSARGYLPDAPDEGLDRAIAPRDACPGDVGEKLSSESERFPPVGLNQEEQHNKTLSIFELRSAYTLAWQTSPITVCKTPSRDCRKPGRACPLSAIKLPPGFECDDYCRVTGRRNVRMQSGLRQDRGCNDMGMIATVRRVSSMGYSWTVGNGKEFRWIRWAPRHARVSCRLALMLAVFSCGCALGQSASQRPSASDPFERSAWLAAAERYHIEVLTLYAIALVESRRPWTDGLVRPWPWTLHTPAEHDMYFPSYQTALAKLREILARGETNVDVGICQISWRANAYRMPSAAELLLPRNNMNIAAQILREELDRCRGDWACAVAHYHSPTPDIGARYVAAVSRIVESLRLTPGVFEALSR